MSNEQQPATMTAKQLMAIEEGLRNPTLFVQNGYGWAISLLAEAKHLQASDRLWKQALDLNTELNQEVQRLTDESRKYDYEYVQLYKLQAEESERAKRAEIEVDRLTAEVQRQQGEIERLTAEREWQVDHAKSLIDIASSHKADADRLQAENDQLREEVDGWKSVNKRAHDECNQLRAMRDQLRQQLGEATEALEKIDARDSGPSGTIASGALERMRGDRTDG